VKSLYLNFLILLDDKYIHIVNISCVHCVSALLEPKLFKLDVSFKMDSRDKSKLDLIVALEHDAEVSQQRLSKKMGIAVGLVNILMKRAVSRGLIKMKQIPTRRYAYYLTPKGFAEKTKLVSDYFDSSLGLYRRLRVDYRELFSDLVNKGIKDITLIGDVDIAELAIMASFDHAIRITTLINVNENKSFVASIPITQSINKDFNGVYVICNARKPQSCFDDLCKVVAHDRIFFPSSFFIHAEDKTEDDEAA
jgi:DNA-binding MarR family transcriptional regulator